MIGRETNKIRLEVCKGTQIAHIQPLIEDRTTPTVCLNTDESSAYNRVKESGRKHQTVCHSKKEFARDENKDGKCEVHCNTTEGLWTGLRNFLRKFRGVSKRYLAQYVAIFENNYNFDKIYLQPLRALVLSDFYLENLTP